jgi:radical SAM protein with 4Fe4S-binding SPASM domain
MKSGSLSGYDTYPFADLINAKRIVRHRLIAEIAKTNTYQIPCYAGSLGACMFANGDILPCELLIDRKLGNVRDVNYDFKKIWYSQKADETRKFIRDTKCFCTYECFYRQHPLNLRMMPKVLKEWGASEDVPRHARSGITARDRLAVSRARLHEHRDPAHNQMS